MPHVTPPAADRTAPVLHRLNPSASCLRIGAGVPEDVDWESEAYRLRAALEDIVALAHGDAEAKHRCVQMHRRALAALQGTDARPGTR